MQRSDRRNTTSSQACTGALAVLWLVACTPIPCPAGTQGDDCRAAATGAQASGGRRPDAPQRAGTTAPPADPHRDVLTATGGHVAGSGGMRALPPSAAGGAPARRASGGSVAIAGRAANGGNGGIPVTRVPARAGAGGEDPTTAGRAPLAGGTGGTVSMQDGGAGTGGMEAGAAGQISLPPGSGWYCLQVGSVCSCKVFDSAPFGNFCLQPMPPCCITLLDDDVPNCQCWPRQSVECSVSKNEAFVPKCPF